jgi:glycerophosphoryl diester phosphodiesterase
MAVRMALDLGAAWIEVDVHLAEGELVVIRDPSLERTTNGRGLKVFSYTVNSLEEVHRLRRMGVDGIFTDYPDLCAGA